MVRGLKEGGDLFPYFAMLCMAPLSHTLTTGWGWGGEEEELVWWEESD